MDILKFEKLLVQTMFVEKDYRNGILPFIKSDYFISEDVKKLVKSVIQYNMDYEEFPTVTEFKTFYENNEKVTATLTECMGLKNEDSTNGEWNLQLMTDNTEKFFKTKLMMDEIAESGEQLTSDNPDFGIINESLERLSKASAFTFDRSVGLDVGENMDSIFDFFHKKSRYIPTGIDNLDRIIGGGSHEKTLNVIMAQPNLGKTLIKTCIASNCLVQNKKVLYITHEMSEYKITERILANLFDVEMKDLYRLNKKDFVNHFEAVNKYISRNLVIKEFPTKTANTNMIRSMIRELKDKKDFVPDIVFNDYMGIMQPNFSNKNSNSYTDIKTVSEELRGLAVELAIPIWTSIQTNRGGINNLDVDLDDMADSIGPGATADVVMSATQTDDMKESREIQLAILKNRFGLNKQRFLVKVDYSKMRITDYEEDELPDAQMKPTASASADVLASLSESSFSGSNF
jgi:hypothetical protein